MSGNDPGATTSEPVECECCDGTGEIDCGECGRPMDCPDCDGTGVDEDAEG
jgi:DnaJ-class molecular chaperone